MIRVFDPASRIDTDVYLRLMEPGPGDPDVMAARLVACDSFGEPRLNGELLYINKDGTITRAEAVPSILRFRTDNRGRVVIS